MPAGTITGTVKDAAGNYVARTVRAYLRDTGALVGSTSSNGATGVFSIATTSIAEHYVIALDATENALIFDKVLPLASGAAPHRYWRILVTAAAGAGGFIIFRDMQLLEGVDDRTTGRGAFVTCYPNDNGGAAANIVDGDMNSEGGGPWTGDFRVTVDLGSAFSIDHVTLTSNGGGNSFSPAAITVQWSDDNSTWVDAGSYSGLSWSGGETKSFAVEGAAPPSYRYWRIYASNAPAAQYGNNSYFRRFELLDSAGADQAAGAAITANVSPLSGVYPFSNLVNPASAADAGSLWFVSGLATEAMFQLDLGSAETISSIGLTCASSWPGGENDFPRSFSVSASSDGNAWTDIKTINTTWASGTMRQVTAL